MELLCRLLILLQKKKKKKKKKKKHARVPSIVLSFSWRDHYRDRPRMWRGNKFRDSSADDHPRDRVDMTIAQKLRHCNAKPAVTYQLLI